MIPPARFTVLASGSSGNASLLEVGDVGLLIDCGLGPHDLTARLGAIGRTWANVTAVAITHTHSDHVNRHALAHLRRRQIPLFAHARHFDALAGLLDFAPLAKAGLTRPFDAEAAFAILPGVECRPVAVPHDADPTFAYRFDFTDANTDRTWALGYASDVGCPTDDLVAAFAGVDVLALEYNHDVRMQRASRRPKLLIDRVLGDLGHLSNVQAAEVTRAIASTGGVRTLVQLHLSRDCNTVELASAAGRAAVPRANVVTATQAIPAAPVPLIPRAPRPVAVGVPSVAKPPRYAASLWGEPVE